MKQKIIVLSIFLSMLLGICFIYWVSANKFLTAYDFWQNGVEKQVTVVELDYMSEASEITDTYFFAVEIALGVYTTLKTFDIDLAIGQTVTVLQLSDQPKQLILADYNSTYIDILSQLSSGSYYGVIGLFAALLFLPLAIILLYVLYKGTEKTFKD